MITTFASAAGIRQIIETVIKTIWINLVSENFGVMFVNLSQSSSSHVM